MILKNHDKVLSIDKKPLSRLGDFGGGGGVCVGRMGGGGGGPGGWVLSESVKKGKFVTKMFFSDNVEWSSKNLLKISADVM